MATVLILCLPVSAQEDPALGKPYTDEDHEFTLKPPAGWVARTGRPPTLIIFTWTKDVEPAPFIEVIHKTLSRPMPLSAFVSELKDYLPRSNPGFEKLWEKERTISGIPAFQIAFKRQPKEGKSTNVIRTVLHRAHLEYFFIDFECSTKDFEQFASMAEATLATFAIQTRPLDEEEGTSLKRGEAFLKAPGPLRSELLTESWQTIHLGSKRFGYQKSKASETTLDGIKGYALATEVVLGRGSSGTDTTTVQGFVAADLSLQKFESVEVVKEESPKRESTFRVTAVLKAGDLQVTRDMNGLKEEKVLKVGEGVLLTDTLDLLRRMLLDQPKGVYLFRTLSLFSDEKGWESVEIAGKDKASIQSKEPKEVYVVFGKADRRKNLTYWFALDKTLYAVRGSDTPFSVAACTMEEAEGIKK